MDKPLESDNTAIKEPIFKDFAVTQTIKYVGLHQVETLGMKTIYIEKILKRQDMISNDNVNHDDQARVKMLLVRY